MSGPENDTLLSLSAGGSAAPGTCPGGRGCGPTGFQSRSSEAHRLMSNELPPRSASSAPCPAKWRAGQAR